MIHHELIAGHGGSPGVRAGGDGLIDSALLRPRQCFDYEPESDLATMAAAYLFGLAKNRRYVDGNKRVAFAVAVTFLLLNGLRLSAEEAEAYDVVMGVAEGRLSEAWLAEWFRNNSVPASAKG